MQTKKTYTLQEATKKLEHYCAYQERCHKEVAQKLKDMYMIPEAMDVIIVHLLQHNFLNEERFAKTFVSGKFKFKNWGKRRLTFELKQKDVSKVNINQALAEISDDEYVGVFNDLAEKKAHSITETNLLKKKKKFIDYFLYRGWESHLVYEKANELIK
ncbi:MAG: RecX family transcriptional regulator [Flavobacteriales bacterium]|nr:RecX family transcriptional regulator [Flavobacteriales bacterium]PJB16641.1 MAG: recombinase RecX [Flavobacteriaceae bacterium CG_4_9_14_3_um_filter_33_16]NCP51498.1 RecX family transcriptional regulator [Flavobacteriales bacterium]NCP61312.1 RecX family transcriptional regulator [Flavobacteriales bacterium]NCP89795.1 RecX family transcriptional regulator [Flavobacteriales bacterium]